MPAAPRRSSAILAGVALVGGGAVSPDPLGVTLAIGAAVVYAVYILASDRLLRGVDPVAYAAVLTTGAAVAFLTVGGAQGSLLHVGGTSGLTAIVGGAVVGSAFALTAFLSGIRLVGPGTASLLVTVEVPVGLTLAALFLGDRLATPQLAGAAVVVAAIVLLQVRVPSLGALRAVRTLGASLARLDRDPVRVHTQRATDPFLTAA